MKRYITTWREVDDVLLWGYYISSCREEVETVISNLIKAGAEQYQTYELGEQDAELSSPPFKCSKTR